MNPLDTIGGIFSNGNLDVGVSAAAGRYIRATIAPPSGKWYWEATVLSTTGTPSVGVVATTAAPSGGVPVVGVTYSSNGVVTKDSTNLGTQTAWSVNDIVGISYDADNLTIALYRNNTLQTTVNLTTGYIYAPLFMSYANATVNSSVAFNFGQRAFAYTAPSGFKALCTQNLPTPAIAKGNQYFDVLTWSGTGGSSGATRSITGLNFQPDFLWEKARSSGSGHQLLDVVRGVGQNKVLASNSTGAEPTPANTESLYGWLSSFNSDGFTTTNGTSTWDNWNKSGDTYVAWNWKAGGTGVTNTAGQITSTVSANTTAGFSIVTFTTDNTTKTVGHGLGVKPSLVIVKSRSVAGNWLVITDILGSMQYGVLNSTAAFTSIGYSAPTSTVFQYNDNNGVTQVAYCFAPVAGYSAFGSYTGNGSADGPFVYTGFRPRWLLFKDSSNGTWPWIIVDTARNTYNVMNAYLSPNNSNAEATNFTGNAIIDATANGFKVRTSDAYTNTSTNTYIYAAFAESPFKYALAR